MLYFFYCLNLNLCKKGYILGFWQRYLIFAFMCLVGFCLPVSAQEGKSYPTIPDFPMHRIVTENPSSPAGSDNSEINLEIPKLRIIVQPEKKVQAKAQQLLAPKPVPVKSVKLKNTEGTKVKVNDSPKPEKKVIAQGGSKQAKSEATVIVNVPDTNKSIAKTPADVQKKPETQNNLAQVSQDTLKKSETEAKTDVVNEQATSDQKLSKVNQLVETKQPKTKGDFSKVNSVNEAGNDFLRAFFSLSIVLLLIFIFAWIYARVKGINPTAILTGKFSEKDLNRFNVLSTSTLGQGKDIHLVEINGKQLVIGSTANSINLLTEIAPEEIEKLKSERQADSNDEAFENTEPENAEPIEIPDEENFYYEYDEDEEFVMDEDYYSSRYSKVYKEYIKDEKKPEETDS